MTAHAPVSADGWYRLDVPVRFHDIDAMGHAHHTLPLIYLEEARAAFWRELKQSASVSAIDYVMAEVTLRFHARIVYPSAVAVALSVRRVGGSSFTTDFEIRDAAGVLLASGSAVQVSFDYDASRSRPLSAADRAVLERWQRARAEADAQNSMAMPAETAPISPPST